MNKIIKIFSLSVLSIAVCTAASAKDLGASFDEILATFDDTSTQLTSLDAASEQANRNLKELEEDINNYIAEESGQQPQDIAAEKPEKVNETANAKDMIADAKESKEARPAMRGFGVKKEVPAMPKVQTPAVIPAKEVEAVRMVPAKALQPAVKTEPAGRTFRQRAPLQKDSKLSSNNKTYASYHSSDIMTFADGQKEEKTYSGYSEYGVFVAPNTLAQECEFNVDDIEEDGTVTDCLDKLLEKRMNPSMGVQAEARKIYDAAYAESVLASIAEAMQMKNTAANYEKNVLQPLEKQLAEVTDLKDAVVALTATDMEISKLLNNILMIYAAKLSLDSVRDFGNNEIKSDQSASLTKE